MNISLRYSDHLRTRARDLTGKRGSENLKIHLMAAAVKALEHGDFRDLRVSDLYIEVGISRATFYLHFSGIGELLSEVATGLMGLELTLMPSLAGEQDAWHALQKLIDWRIQFLEANLYITEACAALSDSSQEINQTWYEYSSLRRQRIVDELRRFSEFANLDEQFIASTIDVIGRGLNGLMYSIAGRNASWSSEQKQMRLGELPQFFSRMIYRALVGSDPS